MGATGELRSPTLDKLSFLIEDHNRIGLGAAGMNSMGNVDVSRFVSCQPVSIAIRSSGWRGKPVVDDLVGVLSGSDDGVLFTSVLGEKHFGRKHCRRSCAS